MLNHQACINGTLQGTDYYSAPVPVIGLYIAAASAICALFMLYDIVVYGLHKKQRWLPCKWFKLNSVTLSLIGVVVKLTVDLTTSMPSALDQLSKLAGTTSLCIYMCYIFPSIPDMKDSTNMFALSILVITVFVNMCIQLSTGVIGLFIPENIIVMCLMLVLLVILWRCVFLARNENKDTVAAVKSDFTAGQSLPGIGVTPDSFLQRLKVCYLDNYKVNPQFRACRRGNYATVGDISLISLAILIQATIRSIVMKKEILCTGESSDYQWSMGMIVASQFAFIVIGSFSSCFRRWTMLVHLDVNSDYQKLIEEPFSCNPIFKGKFFLGVSAEKVYLMFIIVNWVVVFYSITLFGWFLSSMGKAFRGAFTMVKYRVRSEEELTNSNEEERFHSNAKFESFKDFIDRLGHSSEDWIKQKSRSNMEMLIEGSKIKSNGLCELFSSIIPVRSVVASSDVVVDSPWYQEPTEEVQFPPARLHPLVVLVRLVEVAIPESPCQDRIVKAFREAFETLYFIEKHMHSMTREDIKETEIAKALWRAGDFGCLLPVNLRSTDQSPPPVDHAFRVMNCIYKKMRGKTSASSDDSVADTVRRIKNFLSARPYTSTEELEIYMQDLFAYMLNAMLAELPDAIFKAVFQSPDDDFEERVRQSLKHLCKFESWDGVHKWEAPKGCENCPSLFDQEGPDSKLTATQPVQDEGDSGEHHVAITSHDDECKMYEQLQTASKHVHRIKEKW